MVRAGELTVRMRREQRATAGVEGLFAYSPDQRDLASPTAWRDSRPRSAQTGTVPGGLLGRGRPRTCQPGATDPSTVRPAFVRRHAPVRPARRSQPAGCRELPGRQRGRRARRPALLRSPRSSYAAGRLRPGGCGGARGQRGLEPVGRRPGPPHPCHAAGQRSLRPAAYRRPPASTSQRTGDCVPKLTASRTGRVLRPAASVPAGAVCHG
jgi:hypothetical protein